MSNKAASKQDRFKSYPFFGLTLLQGVAFVALSGLVLRLALGYFLS